MSKSCEYGEEERFRRGAVTTKQEIQRKISPPKGPCWSERYAPEKGRTNKRFFKAIPPPRTSYRKRIVIGAAKQPLLSKKGHSHEASSFTIKKARKGEITEDAPPKKTACPKKPSCS